jgi:arginase
VVEQALKVVTNGCDRVHVSFDIDALDPLIAPGSGIVSRGGLSYREITYIMKTIGEAGILSSMDVIEINPLLDVKNRTAELAVELVVAALGGTFGDYERSYLKCQSRPT